ncbi:MAG TPA: hypothetical protein VHL79_09725 [Ramlibacter sp.]|jgi:hypothetical protein|nr:hypothetical protein [Ramlibacter sp.]
MQSPRKFLAIASCFAIVGSAFAQTQGALRWRAVSSPVGLQANTTAIVPCGSYSFGCGDAAAVPLYASPNSPRALSMQVGVDRSPGMRLNAAPGLNVSVVGKTALAWDLGLYGRVGTTINRTQGSLANLAGPEGGLTYGIGLSWDFSRRASAAVGLDSYDMRGVAGEGRDVRTSLGLQWRY